MLSRTQTTVVLMISVIAGGFLILLIAMIPTYPAEPDPQPTSATGHGRFTPTYGDLPGWPN